MYLRRTRAFEIYLRALCAVCCVRCVRCVLTVSDHTVWQTGISIIESVGSVPIRLTTCGAEPTVTMYDDT